MRPLLIPAAAALAGVASLLLLFPRFDPSASLHAVLGRNEAIARTRQLAASRGLKADGWKALAIESLDTTTGPLKIEAALTVPRGPGSFEAAWFPDGRLAWSRLPDERAVDNLTTVHVKAPDGSDRQGGVHVQVDKSLTSRARNTYRPLRVLDVLWRVLAVAYFVVAAFRRRLRYRTAMILAGLLAVWGVVSFWGGTTYDKGRLVKSSVDRMVANGSGDIDVDVGGVAAEEEPARVPAVFWLFLFTAMGVSTRELSNHRKWHTAELVAQRRIFSRAAGSSLAGGLLCGIGIAAIPYWIAATLFRGTPMVFRNADVFAAPVPVSNAWDLTVVALAAGIFGFVTPAAAKVRQPILRWAIVAAIGIVAVGESVMPFSAPAANLFTAVVLFAAFLAVYWKADVLAAMAAMVGAKAVIAPFVLLIQPGGLVRTLALPILLVWGVVLAASLHSALRGKEAEELPEPPPIEEQVDERNSKTGRRRLEAEFEVARQAQQDALPTAAPAIEGYTIAGWCEPAQQVGGDLFDYFPLPDGRLAIAVADVSGKGVPAALYMMMTKGLLAAVTRDSHDLANVLQQVNRHLYSACKKKVFVTLAAVALDPVTRRLQHGRAGHNPILWRRAARKETVVLKPPGLGLGMTAGERFNRTLRIEELELQAGDAIVMYSDGITEAMNAGMELFGDERLMRAVEAADGRTAEESRAAIIGELAAFTNGTAARDDVTLVVLRVNGNGVLI